MSSAMYPMKSMAVESEFKVQLQVLDLQYLTEVLSQSNPLNGPQVFDQWLHLPIGVADNGTTPSMTPSMTPSAPQLMAPSPLIPVSTNGNPLPPFTALTSHPSTVNSLSSAPIVSIASIPFIGPVDAFNVASTSGVMPNGSVPKTSKPVNDKHNESSTIRVTVTSDTNPAALVCVESHKYPYILPATHKPQPSVDPLPKGMNGYQTAANMMTTASDTPIDDQLRQTYGGPSEALQRKQRRVKSVFTRDMSFYERQRIRRERNRIAAKKCRQKKLETIASLEKERLALEVDNKEFENVLAVLRKRLMNTRLKIIDHVLADTGAVCRVRRRPHN